MANSEQKWSWPWILGARGVLILAILLLWGVGYLPGLASRDLRLEEGRRAQPAMEMLHEQQWVVPKLYGQAYLSKPPGFFWLTALVAEVQGALPLPAMADTPAGTGVNALSVRVLSVGAVLIGALLLMWFGRSETRRETRALAALVFLSMVAVLDKGTLGEIDMLLSTVTFAAVAALWAGFDELRGRFALWSWGLAGIFLAASALLKGPGGVAEFYVCLLAFLLFADWGRRERRGLWWNLVSPGHILMLVIMITPVAIWVYMLMQRTGLNWHDLRQIWSTQTGIAVVAGQETGGWGQLLKDHYLTFGFKAVGDLLPWFLLAFPAFFPAFGRMFLSEAPRKVRDFRILCAAAFPALLVFFWLWPKGNPRYMLMVVFPVAMLTALAVSAGERFGLRPRLQRVLSQLAMVCTELPLLFALGAVIAAVTLGQSVWTAGVVAVLTMGITGVAIYINTRTEPDHAGMAFVCSLALLILLARGCIASVLMPHLAGRDALHIMHVQMKEMINPDFMTYTTRTLGRGEEYFDLQFYVPWGARALTRVDALPEGEMVNVICTPEEWEELVKVVPGAQKKGELFAPKGPGRLVVGLVKKEVAAAR